MTIPECVTVEPGAFTIGGSEDDRFTSPEEGPQRRLEIRRFALGKHPVRGAEFGAYCDNRDWVADLPVTGVSWYDAVAYCNWLVDQTGSLFRLPSEAEWEFACRAGTTTPFPTGHMLSSAQANLYYDERGNRVGPGKMLPVGWGKPNAWGLHDMLGNVAEWVADDWCGNYENLTTDGQPQQTGSEWKVIRGGGWDAMPRLARSSFRDFAPADTRRDNLGFRIAKTL